MPNRIYPSVMSALVAGCLATVAAVVPATAHADTWPTKPVRIVVPFAPGGGTDILARILAPRVAAGLGQQIVIENKPGASSIIGTEQVVKSTPDGYTLMMVDTSFMVNPGLQPKLPYDSLKDLVPVVHAAAAPVILVVHASVPVKSIAELVALAKAKPGTLAYASGGNGASTHLAGEQFKIVAGVDLIHIPYKGTAPAIADVIGGQVPMIFAGISTARQQVEAGKLRALAITGSRRNAAMPDVPSFSEVGMPGVDCGSDWGMLAPAGTPREIVLRMNAEMNKALQIPEVRSRVIELGYEVAGGPPEAYAALIQRDIAKWTRVVKEAGIKVD